MKRKNVLRRTAGIVLRIMDRLLTLYAPKRPKLIAFTFDDGPSQYTGALLDGLKARNAVVTFFMNGENGTAGNCGIKNGHGALLTRMWEEGHQMANHTYRHAMLDELSDVQIASEVSGVEQLIFHVTGGAYKCFVRTPGGHINEAIVRNVNAPIIFWSVDTMDWKYRNADEVYAAILSGAQNGSIVLMHDIYESSVAGTLRAVDTLKEQGYELVTVAELMRRTGVDMTNGTVYSRAKSRLVFRSAYEALTVKVLEDCDTGAFKILCSVPAGLTVYYTTDGSYPKLSGNVYKEAVTVNAGTVFTAIGVDRYGTRTPAALVTAGAV